jgi:hypothetical protein
MPLKIESNSIKLYFCERIDILKRKQFKRSILKEIFKTYGELL